ncbi:MAG TPA: prepilin-type N-terminal cleavage/methylation domain-containing protein [Gammaproteobacteria bacterium]|nr:prepilin-type N-terminal cleavage/methylation domain-containing protein [Gammaproteobacteria bacterium]
MKHSNTGFTLIELLMTLIVVSIVVSLGAPALSDIIRNNRLTTQTNTLVTALNLSRSEAIKRNVNITMCASSDQITCTNDGWENGWIIMDDNNQVLRVFEPLEGLSSMASTTQSIQYTPTGFISGGAAVTFDLCAKSGAPGRQINITPTGRPSNLMPYPNC